MTRKKSGFLSFVFSFLPGAGEMYMGFMKQGITLMGAFFLLIFAASWLHMGPLLYVLPVLWCYGFFHVHNLRSMPDEEFYAIEDDYLFHLDRIVGSRELNQKARVILALILIVVGASILWNNLGYVIRWCLPTYMMKWYWNIANMVPQLVVAVLLLLAGYWLIRGKKRQLDEEEFTSGQKKDGDFL